ncbi:Ig-like domain-containing protein [Pseudobacillus badius]|uniref:Ig-like domain-containing protein n=1 Tax=Bacillus badius TaxID=1455 RepID=UPI0007B32CC3|nr:Ig-like domain-containing protein [Bacillus badius]KZR57906.1 hypothetical protein A3781_19205 [Bacillus badius]
MKASDIIAELENLERKRDEINTALISTSLAEPQGVLHRALEVYQKRLDSFLNVEFEPMATVVYLAATPSTLSVDVDSTSQLQVIATLSNGTTKDVSGNKIPIILFRDYDKLVNNIGVITSVDVSDYKGKDVTFEVVKTSTGFDVDDNFDTQGLEVAATGNLNEYEIIAYDGTSLGVKFVTNGQEVTGDNFLLDVYLVNSGTVYSCDDPTVAAVSDTGLVTGVGGGTATITVQNGLQTVNIPITVVDTVAPEPPSILSVEPIVEGAHIFFDPSIDKDVVSYNVYVDGVKFIVEVQYIDSMTPIGVLLTPADNLTEYSITMTAVDSSGNESEHSDPVTVTPYAPDEI